MPLYSFLERPCSIYLSTLYKRCTISVLYRCQIVYKGPRLWHSIIRGEEMCFTDLPTQYVGLCKPNDVFSYLLHYDLHVFTSGDKPTDVQSPQVIDKGKVWSKVEQSGADHCKAVKPEICVPLYLLGLDNVQHSERNISRPRTCIYVQ